MALVSAASKEMVLARFHPNTESTTQSWSEWAGSWKKWTWESVDSFSRQTERLVRKNPLTMVATCALGLAACRNPSVALSRLKQGVTFLPRRWARGISTLFHISPAGTVLLGGMGGVRCLQAMWRIIQNPRRYQTIYEQKRSDALLFSTEVPQVLRLLSNNFSSQPDKFQHYARLWDQRVTENIPEVHAPTWSHLRELFNIKIALYQDIRKKVESQGIKVLDDYTPSEAVAERIQECIKRCKDYKKSEELKEAQLKSPYAKKLLACKTQEEFNKMRHQFSREAHPDKTGVNNDEQQTWINRVVEHIREEKGW